MRQVRCAIYTRKSSDEGLEQSFNSLDAQREACAAYILSQASEGWSEVADMYDDGGLSGGTLERPALKRLLADIVEGRVDIIVVYKVDRLTRSLLDFAKLVEAFDKAGVSFVSITQSFNTTTSMGRLTLNMLLSFAQFEREVTAERIRDKIAASKAKGMWMGGVPPLGYRPDGRTLAIVDEHAVLVREIYRRYLAIGNVRQLADQLAREGLIAPMRTLANGKVIGGAPLHRGQLYLMLKNRIYIGEVPHKQQSYPGLHPPLIDRPNWDAVQKMLADNLQGRRTGTGASRPSLLAGKVFDEAGQPLVPVHATKPVLSGVEGGKVRYRYYVSRAPQHGESDTGMRIPAREIEGVVAERLAAMFDDPWALAEEAALDVVASELGEVEQKANIAAASLRLRDSTLMAELIETVVVRRAAIDISCHTEAVVTALGAPLAEGAPASMTLTADIRLTRSGHMMKLVHSDGRAAQLLPDPSITKLLARGHRYWRTLTTERLTATELAARESVTASYLTRVLRLAFLSPQVTEALLSGAKRPGVGIGRLDRLEAVPADWREQRTILLPN